VGFFAGRSESVETAEAHDWRSRGEARISREGAPYRLTVALQGERIGGSRNICGAEAWQRSFQRLRSANDTLALVFTVLTFMLLGVAVWIAFRLTQCRAAVVAGAIVLGLLVAGLLFLQNLNDCRCERQLRHQRFVQRLYFGKDRGRSTVIAADRADRDAGVAGGGTAYRASQPQRFLQLSKALRLRGLRSKNFFLRRLSDCHGGRTHWIRGGVYVVVQRYFGAWAPQEINYQDSVNTLAPCWPAQRSGCWRRRTKSLRFDCSRFLFFSD